MVLCAGYGTRLRPLTDELPKPLLPFGDRSLLEHALQAAARGGLSRPLVNVHHLHDEFRSRIQRLGLEVEVIHEPSLLGSAGGIFNARDRLGKGPAVVLLGDVVFDEVPSDFADSSRELHLTLAVVPRACGEGTVGIGAGGHVVRLRGERFGTEVSGGDYIGLCSLSELGLRSLPQVGCLVGDFALPLLRAGQAIGTYAFGAGVWWPGDDLSGYWQSNQRWLAARANDGSSIHPSVTIEPGVEVVRAVVADGARLTGRGVISRCVICPGASVQAPLRDALVTPTGRIVRISTDGVGP
jgi:mannose-1-phosphate guanylyltransferase